MRHWLSILQTISLVWLGLTSVAVAQQPPPAAPASNIPAPLVTPSPATATEKVDTTPKEKPVQWDQLKTAKQSELRDMSREDIFRYMAMGFDAPMQFRTQGGGSMGPTGQFEQFRTAVCDPTGVCKNSTGSRTDASQLPPGYQPQNNPNLMVPEIPWSQIPQSKMPCGAVGGLSEIALQTIWGNVNLKLPPMAQSLINSQLKNLLGNLFGKKKDCQDGTFWGVLSNLLNVILPKLGLKGPNFVFDRTNNTFLAPPGTMITLPFKATVEFNPNAVDSYFILPLGGNFNTSNGQKIFIEKNTSVQFSANGSVTTSNGKSYFIDPQSTVTLDPNGVLGVPQGKAIPVDPNVTLFPMGPKTVAPEWAKNPPLKDS